MIAMAVKTDSENSAISPLFGKAKYFALVDKDEKITFLANIEKSGIKAINLLINKGVKTLLMSHIGERPFQTALNANLDIYFVGKERVEIREAITKFKNGEYPNATTIDSSLFMGGKGDHHHHH